MDNYFENILTNGGFFLKFVGSNITHIRDYYKNVTLYDATRSFHKYEESYLIVRNCSYINVGWI